MHASMRAGVQNTPFLKHHHSIHCSIDSGIKSYQPPADVVEARLHDSSGTHHGAAADLPTTVDGFRKRYSSSEYDDDAPERRLLGRCGLPVLCCTLSLLLVAILACTSAATTVAWAQHILKVQQGELEPMTGLDAAAALQQELSKRKPEFSAVEAGAEYSSSSSDDAGLPNGSTSGYADRHAHLRPLFDVIESIRPLAPWKRAVHAASRTKGIASYMGLCAIVKDQREDLLEWIEWHRWAGGLVVQLAGCVHTRQ